MSRRMLVTGGCGFIGSNFIRFALSHTDWDIVNIDLLTYCGNLDNLMDIESPRYRFVHGDIVDSEVLSLFPFDFVVNFAAESHVDRSINSRAPVFRTNILGTVNLLDSCLEKGVERYLQISTDEVYGSLGPNDDAFLEATAISPNSPYSASKAAADCIVRAYHSTYGLPVLITRCSNNFGPYQYPEKIIPLFITNLIDGKKVPVYGDGLNVRDWIHVEDHCSAILQVLARGEVGETYNIGANCEKNNLELTKAILALMDKDESSIEFVTDRLGHDRRYAVDSSKIRNRLSWEPMHIDWLKSLEQTVRWYVDNEWWWRKLKG